MNTPRARTPLPFARKVRLALRVWGRFLAVRIALTRQPLPALAQRLADPPRRAAERLGTARLSRAVDRALSIGPWRPPCLVNALVLYALLREQGDPAELVIGLPETPRDHEAHAWVELGGVDVGPPPGRLQHQALARFP